MKKRIIGYLLTFSLIALMVSAQAFALGAVGASRAGEQTATEAMDSDGDGYVEIDSAEKLWWFTQQVNGGNNSLNVELTANIDLSGTCGADIGNWMPIGNNYSGHFNGQGYTISNLYMTGDELYVGLFGRIYGATIENVTVTGSVSTTMVYDESYNFAAAGGIVAYMDDGTIRNCHVDMTVSGGSDMGGICGTMYDGLIEDCTVDGNVICNALPDQGSGFSIGGIVGCQYGGTVRGCVNRATASAENSVYFGGIAGLAAGDAIENCLNYGNFTAIYDSTSAAGTTAGGIVGSSMTVIRGCGNLGSINISGTGEWTGGIVGLHQTSRSIVENCYNVGSITSSDGKFGVIVGVADANAIATNNYYLSDTTTEDGGRTAEQFASGQVAYELNGSTTADTSVWKQTLGTDNYPTLTGDNVYYVASKKCDGTVIGQTYSNSSKDVIVHGDYIDQIADKDATHHYTQVCSICRTGNEEATAEHTFVDGVCTSCAYACTHSDADSDCLCNICNVALMHKDENSDYLCEVCGSLFDAKAFSDPDLWAYMLLNFDVDNNGVLSRTEIASVTSVDLRGINVIKISGIEHFSNLTEIKCDIDMLWYTMSYDLSRSGIDISKVTVQSGAVIGDLNGKTVLLIDAGETTVVGTYALFEGGTPIALTMSILEPHTHTYEDVVWPDFVKTPATCSTGTIYYKSCECGRISDETFENVDRNPEKHTGTNDKLVSDNAGQHNVVWTCCGVIVSENVACTPTLADDTCLTAETCICGYVIKAAATEHDFSGAYLHDADGHWHKCKNCSVTDTKEEHSGIDDGSCLTAVICYCETVVIEAKDDHDFDNACDTDCNNPGCEHTRITYHEPLPDDGDCKTPVRCAICQVITTEAKEDHSFDNTCDTTCNNKDCKYTRTITHTPNEDDGDCETAIHCKICDAITTPAKSHSYTNACDTTCNNEGCKHTRMTEHRPEADDNDCTTDILCSICDAVTTKGNASHTGGTATCTAKAKCEVCDTEYGEMLQHSFTVPQNDDTDHWNKCKDCDAIDTKVKHTGDDDSDCTTEVKCSCGYVITAGTAHKGGTATCVAKAKCEVCGTEYGELGQHGETEIRNARPASCKETGYTGDTYCKVCDKKLAEGEVIDITAHGETEIRNAKDASCEEEGYTGDKHCKTCGEKLESGTAIAKTAHTYENGKCTVCDAADPNYKPDTPDSPQTGDDSMMWLGIVIMTASLIGVILIAANAKKRCGA